MLSHRYRKARMDYLSVGRLVEGDPYRHKYVAKSYQPDRTPYRNATLRLYCLILIGEKGKVPLFNRWSLSPDAALELSCLSFAPLARNSTPSWGMREQSGR